MAGEIVLNLYEVGSMLGQGSMGRVFLARHRTTGQQVVVKVMHESIAKQKRFQEMFQREMDCMLRFKHPSAVQLIDASLKDPAGPVLVMEYVRGIDLEQVRKRQAMRRLAPARVGKLIGQLCEVLHAAHAHNIIHCDFKPSNLMVLDAERPLEHLKVLDFGLAQLVEESPSRADKGMIGAPGYMSPERIKGQPQDQRSDVYSIGVLLYEMFTGRMPFLKSTIADVLQARLRETPPRFSERAPDLKLPPGVEAVVHICLAKEPAQRPDSALEVARQLERVLGEKILSGNVPTAAPATGSAVRPAATAPVSVRPSAPVSAVPRPSAAAPAATRPAPPAPVRPPTPSRPTMPGTTPNPLRPLRSTLPGTQPKPQPTRSTMQGIEGDVGIVEENEFIFQMPNPHPTAVALKKLGDFVSGRGGKIVKQGADELRIMLAVDLYGSVWSTRSMTSASGSGQLILSEMEMRGDPAGPHLVRLSIRPLGALSKSLTTAFKGRCEQMHADLVGVLDETDDEAE